jgi:hypothetical protein
MVPVVGATCACFGPGDLVSFAHEGALGYREGVYQVLSKKVKVDRNGTESMEVEFI